MCGLRIDVPFVVSFTHRLRFSAGALEPGNATLAEVLEPGDGRRARVMFFVDQGLLAARPGLIEQIDRYVSAHGDRVVKAAETYIVSGGEAIKNDATLLKPMLVEMQAAGLCRRSYAVAIGGGAVLDAVGLAASLVHRGVRLVRLPSTTLAQCDSGVGVKTAINAFGQKNYLGTFAVPWAVVNDATLLSGLSDRDWRAGFSEAVKIALIKDAELFRTIEREAERIADRDPGASQPVLRRTAELHLRHITDGGDPFETGIGRPLDFGHWSAHRLEAMTGHRLRHGEAVSIGLALDTTYAGLIGLCPPEVAQRTCGVLRRLGLPIDDAALAEADDLLRGLEDFREHLGGRLSIPLVRSIGELVNVSSIDRAVMVRALRALVERSSVASAIIPTPARGNGMKSKPSADSE